jgi:hypothetical protein
MDFGWHRNIAQPFDWTFTRDDLARSVLADSV